MLQAEGKAFEQAWGHEGAKPIQRAVRIRGNEALG